MPFWTRARLADELVVLIEDVHQVGVDALALDSRAGGSVDLPPPMIGTWAGFGEQFFAEKPRFPTMWDDLRALQRRQNRWDESDLAWGRTSALAPYVIAHQGLSIIEAWSGGGSPTEHEALKLRQSLVRAESGGLSLSSGFGDVRRSERRLRQ